NQSTVFLNEAVTSPELTRWMPASDVVLRVDAKYHDGAERGVAWHVTLTPGFSAAGKRIRLSAPSARQLIAHPGMAYIPATRWFHGRDNEAQSSAAPYWIDIRPPTVREYLAVAGRLLQSGQLSDELSFVLTARQQSAAVDATGLGQLRRLNQD